jgi:protein O-GlcNAc transferase
MADLNEALALYGQGKLNEAETKILAILKGEPRHIEALKILGSIKIRLEALAEARKIFEEIVSIQPNSADALSNLAYVLFLLNLLNEALSLCDKALAISPNSFAAWVMRGNVLFHTNRLDDALVSYDNALKVSNHDLEALIGRGSVLAKLGRTDEAVGTFDKIPILQSSANLYKRANLQKSLGLYAAAARDYRQLVRVPPFILPAWQGLLSCAMDSCDWNGFSEPREKILTALDSGERIDPLLIMRITDNPAQHLKAAKAVAPRAAPRQYAPAPKKSQGSRLRIAYVSPDFRVHPLAYLIPELLERHDRGRFEVIGVSLGPSDNSDIGVRIAKSFEQFQDMKTYSDDQIVAIMRQMQVDIAIDLAGYTSQARPTIFARRVAPIQVSYLGYCGTSGADYVDYLLADRIVVPIEEQRFFTEKIIYLPDSFMVADSTQPISGVIPSRRECGLPEEAFVFCCFNKNYKITQPVFDVWMRLLRSIEGGVLWLSENLGHGQKNLQDYAKTKGIDPRRIIFAPSLPQRTDHFARHQLADLFLDTLPYNAHTTACDVLFSGVPVITVLGSTFPSRVAASLLHAVGLPELVTESLPDYEALAFKLARESGYLTEIKSKLARNRGTHPLFDTARLTRHIEAAYTKMWEINQRGEAPRNFAVEPH